MNDTLTNVVIPPERFNAHECARIIELAAQQPEIEGQAQLSAKYRDSRIVWLLPGPEHQWVFDKLGRIVANVNKNNYRFDLRGLEPAQVAEYREGAFYDWHMDLGADRACFRKLSISVQLTPESEYDGGELEFFYQQAPCSQQQGAVILFPSYMEHRVTPVTRGARRSLVAWAFGPAFR